MSDSDASSLLAATGPTPESPGTKPGFRLTWAGYLESLEEETRKEFESVESLPEFLDGAATRLTLEKRKTIVAQALLLFEEHYAHLPQKRSMYAHDPVQRLRLLRLKLDGQTEAEQPDEMRFHKEMLSIFASVRDLHTLYLLPKSYRSRLAFLPFTVGEYFERDDLRGRKPKYMVTTLMTGFDLPGFKTADLLSWNGVPVARAVEVLADRLAGGNSAARRVRGLARLTCRPLALSLAPDEEWVDVCFEDCRTGRRCEVRVYWHVFTNPALDVEVAANAALANFGVESKSGLDRESDFISRTKLKLFHPEMLPSSSVLSSAVHSTPVGQGQEPDSAPRDRKLHITEVRTFLDREIVQAFLIKEAGHSDVALIKIHTFAVEDIEEFVTDFTATLDDVRPDRRLPRRGLILDVRGNAGGRIPAAERLLQLFTPGPIEPERFQFMNSARNLELCELEDEFARWRRSIERSVATGATHSRGIEISGTDECNDTGQRYHGPVVLLIDATCYSATDMFIAGFDDHEIGDILGVQENTGAGGASIITHRDLVEVFDESSPYQQLEGAEMQLALRRSIRVHGNAGTPIEDLGVPLAQDQIYRLTKNDLLNGDVGLFATALDLLRKKWTRDFMRLKLRKDTDDPDDPMMRLIVEARNIRGCQAFVDVAELTQEKVSATKGPKDGSEAFTRTFEFSFRGRIFGKLAKKDPRNLSKEDLKNHMKKKLRLHGWHSDNEWETKSLIAVKQLTIEELLDQQQE